MGLLDDLKKNVVDSVSDMDVISVVTTITNQSLSIISKATEAAVSTKKKVPNKSVSIPSKPMNVWERIGCSEKTIEFIKMSLKDGIIDANEKNMLQRRAKEDGIDPQEFDFVLTKALENIHEINRNIIKELSDLFTTADAMATKAMKPDEKKLTSKLPGAMASNNPYLFAGMVIIESASSITSFIKAPSKLNTFKAEIIRCIDIPIFPEVLIDFFGYANSQIIEEQQRKSGKGKFAKWSEVLYGKDIDLVPIWTEKMTHVMTKAVMRYGNSPEIMTLLEKYRTSPLKKLKKITVPEQIENFPIPLYASDYIALVKYSYEKGESIKTPYRASYAHLNSRLLKESSKFINKHPSVIDVINENKVRLVNIVMSNCDNPIFMVQLKTPEDLTDLLEVLHFLSTRKELKKHHQRIYDEGIQKFSSDSEAINKIKQFKPKNLFGF